MKPSLMRLRALRRSAGVGLVTAIFLLVVLAGLGVAVVSVTTAQQAASNQDLQGVRAYQSAKAGIEWALYRALRSKDLGCAATYSFKMPGDSTLSAFTVTVSCTAPVAGVAGNGADDTTAGHFGITSTACNQPNSSNACPNDAPGPDYAQRVLNVQL